MSMAEAFLELSSKEEHTNALFLLKINLVLCD